MNKSKEERLVCEILSKGAIQEHQLIVNDILNIIYSYGFKVSCRDDSLESTIKWDEKWIQVSVKNNAAFNLHVLWSLIHETGHLVNGYNCDKRESEQLAWDYAFRFIERYPTLLEKKESLIRYRDYCLSSYSF